jgi:prepilin-type N-terminal cleavage/methylation domain-containing protein
MDRHVKQNGFSLTEVLIATAILAVGLMMIAMAFPVGVKLTSLAAERTVGTTAANEAFAKFRLYSQDPDGAGTLTAIDCNLISPWYHVNLPEIGTAMPNSFLATLSLPNSNINSHSDELWYPSVVPLEDQKYHWSMLARRTGIGANELQLTVFVTRQMDAAALYYDMPLPKTTPNLRWPVPVVVVVTVQTDANQVRINLPSPINYTPPANVPRFFIEGCTVVDDATGEIYRVVEMKDMDADTVKETLVLNRPYSGFGSIWVVPPAVGSSRNPCIFVQQKIVSY